MLCRLVDSVEQLIQDFEVPKQIQKIAVSLVLLWLFCHTFTFIILPFLPIENDRVKRSWNDVRLTAPIITASQVRNALCRLKILCKKLIYYKVIFIMKNGINTRYRVIKQFIIFTKFNHQALRFQRHAYIKIYRTFGINYRWFFSQKINTQ